MRISVFQAMYKRIILIVAACALQAACATAPKLGGSPNLTVLPGTELPVPQRADLAAVDRPYYIGPRDKVTIDVFGAPDLTQKEIEVDSAGKVSFPLAGSVDAVGKTPAELSAAIADRLRGVYFRDPKVTVNLVEGASQVVTVEGEVQQPGIYPVIGRMTLMDAVASAKGMSKYAAVKDVVVFRNVGERRYAALYNMQAIREGAYDDPQVYANDVVMVGDSRGRRLFDNLLQILPVLTTPLIVWLQQ
jgi:polysaccharide export outer membrane protein